MLVIEMNSPLILTGCNPRKTEDCIAMQLLCLLSTMVSYSLFHGDPDCLVQSYEETSSHMGPIMEPLTICYLLDDP